MAELVLEPTMMKRAGAWRTGDARKGRIVMENGVSVKTVRIGRAGKGFVNNSPQRS